MLLFFHFDFEMKFSWGISGVSSDFDVAFRLVMGGVEEGGLCNHEQPMSIPACMTIPVLGTVLSFETFQTSYTK